MNRQVSSPNANSPAANDAGKTSTPPTPAHHLDTEGQGIEIKPGPLAETADKKRFRAELQRSDPFEGAGIPADEPLPAGSPDDPDSLEVERLSRLSALEYDRQRERSAKSMGARVASLDVAVKQMRAQLGMNAASAGNSRQGKGVLLTDPEPLPEDEVRQLDGASILQEIAGVFTNCLTLPEHAATVLALWVVFTWLHDAFPVSPMLVITSPERECGKTTLLGLLRHLVRKPFPSANATAAALFRIVDQYSPTVLADEVDKWLKQGDERMGIVNCGWERNLANVSRVEGDDNQVRTFSTWAPKALAGIGTMPDEIAGRAIEVRMRRQTEAEGRRLVSLRASDSGRFEPLRRALFTWTQAVLADGTLSRRDPALPDGFSNRLADNWRVLFAIAETAGEEWPERVRDAALAFTAQGREQSWGEMLIADIYDHFTQTKRDRALSVDIIGHLNGLEDRPWPEYAQGRPMTARQLSRKLSSFGIAPRQLRISDETGKGYYQEDFEEPYKRYCLAKKPAGESAQPLAPWQGLVEVA